MKKFLACFLVILGCFVISITNLSAATKSKKAVYISKITYDGEDSVKIEFNRPSKTTFRLSYEVKPSREIEDQSSWGSSIGIKKHKTVVIPLGFKEFQAKEGNYGLYLDICSQPSGSETSVCSQWPIAMSIRYPSQTEKKDIADIDIRSLHYSQKKQAVKVHIKNQTNQKLALGSQIDPSDVSQGGWGGIERANKKIMSLPLDWKFHEAKTDNYRFAASLCNQESLEHGYTTDCLIKKIFYIKYDK